MMYSSPMPKNSESILEDIVEMEEEILCSNRGLEPNKHDADQKAANSAARNAALDNFMTETEKATKAMNRYKARQKELYGKKKLFSHPFEVDATTPKVSMKAISSTISCSDVVAEQSKIAHTSLTKTQGMKKWADRIKLMRSNEEITG